MVMVGIRDVEEQKHELNVEGTLFSVYIRAWNLFLGDMLEWSLFI